MFPVLSPVAAAYLLLRAFVVVFELSRGGIVGWWGVWCGWCGPEMACLTGLGVISESAAGRPIFASPRARVPPSSSPARHSPLDCLHFVSAPSPCAMGGKQMLAYASLG